MMKGFRRFIEQGIALGAESVRAVCIELFGHSNLKRLNRSQRDKIVRTFATRWQILGAKLS